MTDPTDKPGAFYVTTPIYYVNDKPHLGHVYTTMVADVVARYHRLKGDDTFFLTGVDEHAAKVSDKAAEHGLSPQAWADQNAAAFRETFEKLEMTNDDFVRTSSDRHKQKVSEYVAALLKSGDVYEGQYEGWYDAGQEEYVPENKAKDNDYKSDVNGKPLVKKSEKNYFFRLENYRDELIHLLADKEEDGTPRERPKREDGSFLFDVKPDARRNEIVNRIREAKDVPISRTGSGGWGIPVPGDEEQTIYVWIDALFNYLTYVDDDDRRKYWEAGAVHFIAKDILWFHAAIWPALLIALSKCEGYGWVNLPRLVYSHSYWVSAAKLDSGETKLIKMGKSTGNFLDPETLNALVDQFGIDALRYFLGTRGPLSTNDTEFSQSGYIDVYNSDLANTFGNSCSRVSNMIGKYFDGATPEATVPVATEGEYGNDAEKAFASVASSLNALDLAGAGDAALALVRSVDAYIDETAPFKRAKDPEKLPEVGTILYNCAEALRIASILLWPFIPDACEKFWQRIGCDYAEQLSRGQGKLAEWGQLKPGTPIEKGDALFPRYQVEKK